MNSRFARPRNAVWTTSYNKSAYMDVCKEESLAGTKFFDEVQNAFEELSYCDPRKSNQMAQENNHIPPMHKDINRNMTLDCVSNHSNYLKTEIIEDSFADQFSSNFNFAADELTSSTPKFTPTNELNIPTVPETQQMDKYRDLILRHLIKDIISTCEKLQLPINPSMWSAEQVSKWVREMCQQFNLPIPEKRLFLSGAAFLKMTPENFLTFAAESGDTLYAQLQLWKTAFDSYRRIQLATEESTCPNVDVVQTPWINFPGTEGSYGYSQNSSFIDSNSSPVNERQRFYSTEMPSPTSSEISSSPSVTGNGEEDSVDIRLFNLQQPLPNGFGDVRVDANMNSEKANSFSRHGGTIHLWHFIRELLDHPKQYGSCVRWVDREQGTFKIESSHHLARFWGQRKNRSQMNYDKLSRSLRQYYKKGIIQKPEKKQRLVYKFLPPYHL
ncbi:unnamed protein product [Auanema sp. JU1783]|nr:unnamed protein product [Auanema sp. JU1783]